MTGKGIAYIVSIEIGGCYLGAEFVAEALRRIPFMRKLLETFGFNFLRNVDPVAVKRGISRRTVVW